MANYYLRVNSNLKRSELFGYKFLQQGKLSETTLEKSTPISVVALQKVVKGNILFLLYLDNTYTKFECIV